MMHVADAYRQNVELRNASAAIQSFPSLACTRDLPSLACMRDYHSLASRDNMRYFRAQQQQQQQQQQKPEKSVGTTTY